MSYGENISGYFEVSGSDLNASTVANNTTTNTDSVLGMRGNTPQQYCNVFLNGASYSSSTLVVDAQHSEDNTNWVNVPNAPSITLTSSNTSSGLEFITNAPYRRLKIVKTGTDALTLTAKYVMNTSIDELTVSSSSLPDKATQNFEVEIPIGGNSACVTIDQNDTTNNPSALVIENAGSGKDIETEALSLTNGKITLVDSTGFEIENAATGNAVAFTVDQNDTTGNNIALKIENAGSGADIDTEALALTNGKITTKSTVGIEIETLSSTNEIALTIDQNDTTGNKTALKIENAGTGKDIETEALSLTNGKITLVDSVGFEIENAATGNAVALTIDQNDTTGNNAALVIENAGTGNDITATAFSVSKAGDVTMNGLASGATAVEINRSCDRSAMIQTMTTSGAVTAGVQAVYLNHASTAIASTIATAVAHQGFFFIKAGLEPAGGQDHTCTLTIGTWNGTNTVATFADINDSLLVYFDASGNGTIITNTGSVSLS